MKKKINAFEYGSRVSLSNVNNKKVYFLFDLVHRDIGGGKKTEIKKKTFCKLLFGKFSQ